MVLVDGIKSPTEKSVVIGDHVWLCSYVDILKGVRIPNESMVLNLIHLIDAPIYSAYCLKIKISTFYPVILRHLIACVVNVILIRVLAGVLPYPSSWLILCVDCLIVGVCALLVEFIVLFDRNEISEFARKVKNKIA